MDTSEEKKKKNTLSIYVETVNFFLSGGWYWLYLKNWLPFSMSSKDSTTLTEQDLLINQRKKKKKNCIYQGMPQKVVSTV